MSHHLYVLSVFTHIVSACIWLGGMLFLILAFIPGIKNHPDKVDLIANVSLKFRTVGTVALILLLITGLYQLEFRGVQWNIDFFMTTFGKIVALKLLIFIGIILISIVHDYFLGSKAIEAWKKDPEHAETIRLRNSSRMMGRISFLFAILAVFLGVLLSRGW
jgi:putative copper export protein